MKYNKRWYSEIMINGKRIRKCFTTIEDAANHRKEMEILYQKDFRYKEMPY